MNKIDNELAELLPLKMYPSWSSQEAAFNFGHEVPDTHFVMDRATRKCEPSSYRLFIMGRGGRTWEPSKDLEQAQRVIRMIGRIWNFEWSQWERDGKTFESVSIDISWNTESGWRHVSGKGDSLAEAICKTALVYLKRDE